tara:strand:- start:356 stop:640 length:285 start_codon:yes stop_codon:yes gene_type:complete
MRRTDSTRTYKITIEGPGGFFKEVEAIVPFYYTGTLGQAKTRGTKWPWEAFESIRAAAERDIRDTPAIRGTDGKWVASWDARATWSGVSEVPEP